MQFDRRDLYLIFKGAKKPSVFFTVFTSGNHLCILREKSPTRRYNSHGSVKLAPYVGKSSGAVEVTN